MTTLTLELPPDLYKRLQVEAERLGKPASAIVQDLLAERLTSLTKKAMSESDQVTKALPEAGLLAELGPEMQKRAAQATMTLEEVQAALDRAGGKPLSEIVLEMRGPKE